MTDGVSGRLEKMDASGLSFSENKNNKILDARPKPRTATVLKLLVIKKAEITKEYFASIDFERNRKTLLLCCCGFRCNNKASSRRNESKNRRVILCHLENTLSIVANFSSILLTPCLEEKEGK